VPDVSPIPGAPEPDVQHDSDVLPAREDAEYFPLDASVPSGITQALPFASLPNGASSNNGVSPGQDAAADLAAATQATTAALEVAGNTLFSLSNLRVLGQLRDSFILAVNEEGLWIIDQHVAHERVLFEKILRERQVEQVQRQRLLMPVLIDLRPDQMPLFAAISEELERNGFEAEPFGPRTLAVKAAPVALEGQELERMLNEVLEQTEREQQAENLETRRTRIAASIACHAAIKINTPLEATKMEWLLAELAKTEHPTNCPHGRPIVLRYSLKDIQRAFQRI